MNENKAMWDVIQKRADNNPYLSRCYRHFIINKAKLVAIERDIEREADNKNEL